MGGKFGGGGEGVERLLVAAYRTLAAINRRSGNELLPWHRRSSYEPDAPARGVPQSPRWRVGLVCARMRNFLAGVISPERVEVAAKQWAGIEEPKA